MKTWLFLISAMAMLATPALADRISNEELCKKICPQKLFEEAKQQCPERATTEKGWEEIRVCIDRAKTEIILARDTRAGAVCSKYQGAERASCAHFTYLSNRGDWKPIRGERQQLQWEKNQREREEAARKPGYTPFQGVGIPGWFLPGEDRATEESLNRQGKNHEAVEREMIERAKRIDPRSHQSTFTGPTTPKRIEGGGTESRKIDRPDFLKKSQGIDLPTRTEGRQGHIGVDSSEVEQLVGK